MATHPERPAREHPILVVEDEPLVALYLENVLLELGFSDIRMAYDLEGGEAILNDIRPVLAILDVNIGQGLIFPLAEKLRELNIPFVFSTGWGRGEFPDEWLSQPIVPKPFTSRTLASAIAGLGIPLN